MDSIISVVVVGYPVVLGLAVLYMLVCLALSLKDGQHQYKALCVAMLLVPVMLLAIFFDNDSWVQYLLGFGAAIVVLVAIFWMMEKHEQADRANRFELFKHEHPESIYLPNGFGIHHVERSEECDWLYYYMNIAVFEGGSTFPTRLSKGTHNKEEFIWKRSEYTPPSTDFMKREHCLDVWFNDGVRIHFNFPIEMGKECGWMEQGYDSPRIAIKLSR